MTVPGWLCIPFVGLLLSVALFPILKPDWWDKHEPHAVIFWSLLVIVLFTAKFGVGKSAEMVLDCIFNDYLTFIVLLFGLYCVSGNITFAGDLAGSPGVNVFLLAVGTLLLGIGKALAPLGVRVEELRNDAPPYRIVGLERGEDVRPRIAP